jgi:hypothetical protein
LEHTLNISCTHCHSSARAKNSLGDILQKTRYKLLLVEFTKNIYFIWQVSPSFPPDGPAAQKERRSREFPTAPHGVEQFHGFSSGRAREGIIPSRPPEASFLFPFSPNPIVNKP